jgi:diguanylate cyclase (GGDEF)-like protein
MLPVELRRDALMAQTGVPHLLMAPGLSRVSVMPIHRNGQARGILISASRTPVGNILEQKFLHMAGAFLADQVLGQLAHRQEVEQLEQAAGEDILTGSMNRRSLMQTLRRQIATHHRSGLPIGVLMVDVDHFKSINDRYGHQAGDEVLRSIARRLASTIRDDDYLGRFGGEEFVVIVYPCPGDVIGLVGERLRKAVARTPFRIESAGDPFDLPVTISVGGALFEGLGSDDATEDELIKLADAALYESKTNGRNRVTVHRPSLAQTVVPIEGL